MLPSRLAVLARPAAAVLLSLGVVACGVSGSDPSRGGGSGGGGSGASFDPAATELEVRFQDSSVPPQYHRSYVLTVEGQQARVVVDSYGDVLEDETVDLPDDVWEPFVAGLPDALADIGKPEGVDADCTGGTSIAVTITSDDDDFTREVSDCGSDRNEAIAEELAALLAPIYDAVDLQTLTATN